jgi:hypothetical protein
LITYHGQATKLPRRHVSREKLCLRGTARNELRVEIHGQANPIPNATLEIVGTELNATELSDAQALRRRESLGARPLRSNKRRCFAGSTRSQPINLRESVKGDIQNFAVMAKVQRRGAKQSGGVEFFIINLQALAFRIDSGPCFQKEGAIVSTVKTTEAATHKMRFGCGSLSKQRHSE